VLVCNKINVLILITVATDQALFVFPALKTIHLYHYEPKIITK